MSNNILREVIYPTGGKTVYDFEANDYFNVGGDTEIEIYFESEFLELIHRFGLHKSV